MQIDPSQVLVIITTHPNNTVDYSVLHYLDSKNVPRKNITVAGGKGSIVEKRNTLVKDILSKQDNRPELSWVLFLDEDVTPTELTNPIWDSVDFDIVGCEYDLPPEKKAWVYPDTFHMGCVRVRIELFRKLKLPVFMFEYNEEGTRITSCECGYFKRKALEVGASITRRGYAEHTAGKTWVHTA